MEPQKKKMDFLEAELLNWKRSHIFLSISYLTPFDTQLREESFTTSLTIQDQIW